MLSSQRSPTYGSGGDTDRAATLAVDADSKRASAAGVSVTFKHFSLSVRAQTQSKAAASTVRLQDEVRTIVNNCSGLVSPGKLLAIMGSSGSGKTSLLDAICCRAAPGLMAEGSIYFNSQRATPLLVRDNVAYVQQDDRLLPNLTVRETFTYAALMRLPTTLTHEQKLQRVDSVLTELGLSHVAGSKIGGAHVRGISGGERRRVSIGVQLLKDPRVLLLDEPTSGLDSFTAARVMQILVSLAKQRSRTVICTLHQPSSAIFAMLDQVMLMSQGRSTFFGPGDTLVKYFETQGFPCPPFVNPLDHYMDVISVDHRSTRAQADSTQRMLALETAFSASPQHAELLARIDAERDRQRGRQGQGQEDMTKRQPSQPELQSLPAEAAAVPVAASADIEPDPNRVSWYSVLRLLVSRAWTNIKRDGNAMQMRLLQLFLFSTLLFLFMNHLNHDQNSIQNRSGLLYQTTSPVVFIGMLTTIALFPALRNLYYREHREGLYGPGVFLAGYLVHIFPFCLIASALFSVFVYWAIGLNPIFERFLVFSAIVFYLFTIGELFGVIALAVFYDPNLANSVSALVLSFAFLLSSGFLRSTGNMPQWLQTLGYGSPYKYVSNLLVTNEFLGLSFDCPQDGTCAFATGDAFVASAFPESVGNNLRDVGLLAAFFLLFLVMAFLTLRFRKRTLR